MKKRKIGLILCMTMALASVSFIACTNKEEKMSKEQGVLLDELKETKNEKAKEEKNNIDMQKDEEKDSELESLKSDSKDNIKVESNIVDKNEKLKYPIFEEEKTNKIVQEYIKKVSSLYELAELNYKIMYKDNKIVSIFFFGNINAEFTAYPSKFESTLNIDLEAAKIIKLSDSITIDEAFIEKFKEALVNKCITLGVNASDLFDLNNLGDLLRKADDITEYLPEVQSYFTKDEVTVILTVPHAIGDYIEVSVTNTYK